MKKTLCVFLFIIGLLYLGSALATDMSAVPFEIGETINVSDRFTIQIISFSFISEYKFYHNRDDFTYSYGTNRGDDTHQFMCIEFSVLNTSMSEINVLKNLAGYVIYRGKYPFNGIFYQRDISRNNYIITNGFKTGVLEEAHVVYLLEAPNILETSKDSLDFIITLDDSDYIVKLR